MSHTWSFLNRSALIQLIKASECVPLKDALELGQVALRMFTLAIGRVCEPHRRRSVVAGRPAVADVGPEAAGFRLAGSWRKHRQRRIVPVQLLCIQHVAAQNLGHRFKQCCSFAHPAGKDGAIQVNAFTREDLGLTMQWGVVCIFGRDHMRQQARSGKAAIENAFRSRRLHHSGALPATHLGAHMTDHEEAGWSVFEHFRYIFAELAQLSATAGTCGVLGEMRSDFTPQMYRKSTALAGRASGLVLTRLRRLWHNRLGLDHGSAQAQHQLIRVDRRLLRLRTKVLALQLGNHQFQMFDPVDLREHQLAQCRRAHLL